MKNLKKLMRYKNNKLEKKIMTILYYIACFCFIILSASETPVIKANLYDMVIYKISVILISLSFLVPMILISNYKIKKKIPILKRNKWWCDVFGFIIIFMLFVGAGNVVKLFHSKDYQLRYNEYYSTYVIYQNQESDEVPITQESSSSESDLNNSLNDLIVDNDKESSIVEEEIIDDNDLKVHFIDVGQGDAIFIELPNHSSMLIDSGESSYEKIVYNYINSLGYSKIDYLIGTHPHTDHIGGLAYIINNFSIGSIYMPKVVSTSKTYENLLNTIIQNNLKVISAKAGVNILNGDDLKIDIIAPNSDSYSDLNNYSVVVMMTYKNRTFLFMGDAELISENEITGDISCDVIKVGHHGSDSSSGKSFIKRVNPKYAIIMVGEKNRYDHPYQKIIDRWENNGAKIYRTDLNGTIVVTSDGESLDISLSK